MAERFGVWRGEIEGSPELEWVDLLLSKLPPTPDVLELGCGAAAEPTRRLARRGRLTGIDLSAEQLRRARENCPEAEFREADMTEVEFEGGSFDAVVSLYAFNHVPRAELAELVPRIAKWLRPGGYLLATFGCSGGEGIEEGWLGVPMFFASFTEDENRSLLRAAGFQLERDEVVPIREPDGEARFHWILARS